MVKNILFSFVLEGLLFSVHQSGFISEGGTLVTVSDCLDWRLTMIIWWVPQGSDMIMHPNCGLSTSSHYDTRDASGSPQNPHIGLIKWVAAITRGNLTYMWVRGLAHLHPYMIRRAGSWTCPRLSASAQVAVLGTLGSSNETEFTWDASDLTDRQLKWREAVEQLVWPA